MATDKIKIGLLGVGRMGQNHLRNILQLKDAELSFIYDVDRETCAKLSAQYGVAVSEDLDADMKKVDGVVIVTPTFTHFDYIKRAAECVKNIFVEKPLTDSAETAREVVKLAEEKGLNIQVGFIERYNPAVASLKAVMLNSSSVINAEFNRSNKVASGRITDVDVVIDLMIHDIDLALGLNGKAVRVSGHGCRKNGMIEYARALVTHENGRVSDITASRITEKRIRQVNIACEDMFIDCNLLNKEVRVHRQPEQTINGAVLSAKDEAVEVKLYDALQAELSDFLKLCRGEKTQASDVYAGLESLEIAEEIRKQI
ncbi:Gfo/Idh/MocA family protein [Seleniivibrio woodruffii]|uniref:Putative dehydrogenase n=1 Tax=Seleniivibrio woodruffii TaxID=1078050 RepID=A0A4R1KCT9_9BACT|nr:Gfo/Idh/MocA family oxidoreductase [Seleniivibrio woodruffii]TCK62366.1 putative dehydrogenase [Seleniivibrio woodruffii]TVZ34517.1 putative dehydrogenase [Seleniivibrio woodruffii]